MLPLYGESKLPIRCVFLKQAFAECGRDTRKCTRDTHQRGIQEQAERIQQITAAAAS